jgi:hypothetical protein
VKQIKLLGWLWVVWGGFWSLLALVCLIGGDHTDWGYLSRLAWWEEVFGDTLECVVFVMSSVAGFALLRGRPWSRPAIWVLGLIWLAFSVLVVSCASNTIAVRMLWFGPSLAIALYSFVVLLLVRYERKSL